MALICPTCRTENRDAAKFCKGCGGKLVSLPPRSAHEAEALDDAWGATVVASLEDDLALPPPLPSPPPPPLASRPSALHTASIEPSPERSAARSRRRRSAPPPRDRSVFWVLLAAATIVVATGGLYVYRDQRQAPLLNVVQEPASGAPSVPAVAPKSPALPITGAITGAVTPEATPPAAPPQAVSPPPAVVPPAVAARKPRQVASATAVPVATPPVAAAPVVPVAPAPEPVVAPPADPSEACAGRGFFATSQCLVVQCAKPEFSAHARCDAVRQQQRIDEEKRNPSNAA